MKPNAKKRRLNKSETFKELELLDLNDDCIRSIFWKLPSPTDLCSMSFTCKRMKDLAFDHFPRQYPDDQVTIGMDESTNPIFRIHKTRKHLRFFSKCIRNAKVFSAENDSLRCLFDFLHTESVRLSVHIDCYLQLMD